MVPCVGHILIARASGLVRLGTLATLAAVVALPGCLAGKTSTIAPAGIAESRHARSAAAHAAFAEQFDEARRVAALELWRQGDVAGCASILEDLCARRPADPAIRTHLAELAWSRGDLSRAEREYRTALELAPDRADLRDALDIVLAQAGGSGEAEVNLASAAVPSAAP